VVDYEKYGQFTATGTARYRYLIRNREGLAKAVGEGIYPNVSGLLKDPIYQQFKYNGKLEGSLWDFVNADDLQANFYKWASAQEQPGVKQFYTADMLDKAGLLTQAVKAYYACVIHFPKTTGTTFWKTPWYIGPTALDRVAYLTRTEPELGMKLIGGRVKIKNTFDDDVHNDVFEIDPGQLIAVPPKSIKPPVREDTSKWRVKTQRGHGQVVLKQYENGEWEMFVDSQPFMVRAVSYSPSPVGASPDNGTLVQYKDWQLSDVNKNEKIDGPYESWVDKNRNNVQDRDEPVVGDWKLLKDMGANAIRLYHHGYNKKIFSDLYQNYGIRLVIGDFLGAYTVGSGADWYAGTDYTNPDQQKKMMESVRDMVMTYKDEPYVLMWVLGNENNYGNANNSRQKPDAYYAFVNEVAKMIKSIDPNHPVALCNGDLLFLDKVARDCPDVDLYGANAYRGNRGFGDSFWRHLRDVWKKPVFISEFGCPAYHHRRPADVAERMQAEYLQSNWVDIEYNAAGMPGAGNSTGGVLIEFNDEWWKAGPPPQYDARIQDIVGQFGGPFPDGWSYEDWYGVVSNGDGKDSPFKRQLRKSYFLFKDELWNAKKLESRGFRE
jgi:beta-glucuronidase